jgi:hypothetical protein
MGQAAFRQSGGRKPLGAFPQSNAQLETGGHRQQRVANHVFAGRGNARPDGFASVMKRETAAAGAHLEI